MLTGPAIEAAVMAGDIVIDPFDPQYLNANSYDCHLSGELFCYEQADFTEVWRDLADDPAPTGTTLSTMHYQGMGHGRVRAKERWDAIDSRRPPRLVKVGLHNGAFCLHPGVLYLGSTLEHTATRGYAPALHGRSSTGRLGVFAHVTAGLGDNGFSGTWTVELAVVHPILLYPGQRLFQLVFHPLTGEQTFYGQTGNSSGRYQGQRLPRPAEPIVAEGHPAPEPKPEPEPEPAPTPEPDNGVDHD